MSPNISTLNICNSHSTHLHFALIFQQSVVSYSLHIVFMFSSITLGYKYILLLLFTYTSGFPYKMD